MTMYHIRFAFQIGDVLLTRRVVGTGTIEEITELFQKEIPEARYITVMGDDRLDQGDNPSIQFLNV